jgi:2-C-methyl-D-erythritol 2,4-cyclodiphosphate synthase
MSGADIRIGLGTDSHSFGNSVDALVLGGVEFEGLSRLSGHSDGDALCHAIIDALLGAADMGDIGEHFPDTDPQWKDVHSTELVTQTIACLHNAGWQVINVDCVVIAESPSIGPRRKELQTTLSALVQAPVSVKGKTPEGRVSPDSMLECSAVALLSRIDS